MGNYFTFCANVFNEKIFCGKCKMDVSRYTYHCEYCSTCVSYLKSHCYKCGVCTNKNSYHCNICNMCVNDNYIHCQYCHIIVRKKLYNYHSKIICNYIHDIPMAINISNKDKLD